MPSASMLALVAACAAGLLLTLCLAAWLTPRDWWRRPNARAFAVLACGTALFAALLHAVFGPQARVQTGAMAQAAQLHPEAPVAGGRYRAWDNLNLRAAVGVGAPRLAIVPAGAPVTATGRREGDWWQVTARVGDRQIEGWASSLWLRRTDEGASSLF